MRVYLGLGPNGSTNPHVHYLIDVFNRETTGKARGGFVEFCDELERILKEEYNADEWYVRGIMRYVNESVTRLHGEFSHDDNEGLRDTSLPDFLDRTFLELGGEP
jgi:hypothetical protein